MKKNIKTLESITQKYITFSYPVLAQISLKIKKIIIDQTNKLEINEFKESEPFQKILHNLILTGLFFGKYTHTKEIILQTKNFSNFVDGGFNAETGFAGAVDFFKNKKIFTIEEYNLMSKQAKELSFAIAKITDITVTEHIQNLIVASIEKGMDLETYKIEIDNILKAAGITPLNTYYIENIYRTNLFSTYNIGRRKAGIEDKNTEGWQYVAVADTRTRPEHMQLNGITAKKNDEIWNDIYPPIDYLCRCTTIPISSYYAERKGIEFGKQQTESGKMINYNKQKAKSVVGKTFGSTPVTLPEYTANILKGKK